MKKLSYATLVVLSIFLFVNGCGPKNLSFAISPRWKEIEMKKVVVIPFVYAPEDKQQPSSSRKDMEAPAVVTSLFIRGIEKRGYMVIPLNGETKGKITPHGTLPCDVVKSIGKKTGAEAVLTGIITRYEEREGGPIGVGKPASVGFEANLISSVDGNVIWKGVYTETQKSLLEDISMFSLFIKRGWKWLTAEELAQYGVERLLKSLPEKILPKK